MNQNLLQLQRSKNTFVKWSFFTIAALIFVVTISPGAKASGSTGYRYWGYFQASPNATAWTMAMTGPTTNVADGSVEGWIHTFSSEGIDAMAPRLTPNFAKLCAKVRPIADKKRVGVIVDFGVAAIRPKSESIPKRVATCVQIEKSATGAEILASVAKIRAASSGFICGVNGYPAKECSAEIKTPRTLLKK